ncbi:hypothetical protein LSAT2_014424, partial [Lamellibrachia satsuma]
DDDEDKLLRMVEIMLAKRRRSQEKGKERRWGMCGTEETKYLDHTFDKISFLDAHPKDGVCGAGLSRMLGEGAHKKQEVMTSEEVMTNHVSTDSPISCRYPPVSEKWELVHKYTPVGG